MDLNSRLDGYLNHEIAYPNPIPSLPVPKTLHDKKDTTLLEMALKAFVKERLFGRFNIYDKDNKQNPNHLSKTQFTTAQNSRCISVNENNSGAIKALKRDNNLFMLPETSHGNLTEQAKVRLIKVKQQKDNQNSINLELRRLSQISSSFDFKPKRFTETKSLANSHAKIKSKHLTRLHQSFNLKHSHQNQSTFDQEDYPGTSFISAIDDYEKQKPLVSFDDSSHKFKLPEIHDKRKKLPSKIDLSKNIKSYTKKQILPQLSVRDQFWHFLSKDKQQKSRRIRQNKPNQINQSVVSMPKSTGKIDQIKNTSLIRNNGAGLLNKDSFQAFLNNSKISIPFFKLSIINFFQLMNKITDKCKKTDFQTCFSNLFNLPDRAWSVALFRFFDINTDGKIDSSDLFKIHNLIQDIIEKIQNYKPNSEIQKSLHEDISSKKKAQKRQKTQISQNQSLVKNNQPKSQIKDKKNKQKTDQSQKISEESYQIVSSLMSKNLENLKIFQKYLQKLNLRFLQKDKSITKNNDSINPQNEKVNKNINDQKKSHEIRYLEEALLRNKDLKISDLSLILEQMTNQKSKVKKKVIDIDYKKMNIKLSSSYVQTFIATNHNQETRMNREHLQSLKDSLKSQQKGNGRLSNIYEPKQLPCIKYAQFYEEKLFLPLKSMFFQCFYSDIAETK